MQKIASSLFICLLAAALSWAGDPTDIDSLFRGKEYKPELSSALRDTTDISAIAVSKGSAKESKGNGYYVLQFEAVGDFDAAQRRKAQISASTGYNIQVVFDAPFYKLRGGGWTSKKAAEDMARELSIYNINALVIKLK